MSHASETGEVRFGGKDYAVQAFTLDDLQVVLPQIDAYFVAMASGDKTAVLAPARIVAAKALGLDDATVAAARTDFAELWDVVKEAARVTGLKRLGERMRAAAAALPSIGTTSMPSLSPSAPETGGPSAG